MGQYIMITAMEDLIHMLQYLIQMVTSGWEVVIMHVAKNMLLIQEMILLMAGILQVEME